MYVYNIRKGCNTAGKESVSINDFLIVSRFRERYCRERGKMGNERTREWEKAISDVMTTTRWLLAADDGRERSGKTNIRTARRILFRAAVWGLVYRRWREKKKRRESTSIPGRKDRKFPTVSIYPRKTRLTVHTQHLYSIYNYIHQAWGTLLDFNVGDSDSATPGKK